MKIYIAATFSEQKRIRKYKEQLIQMGHSVLSTWLEEQLRPAEISDEQFNRKMAAKDLQEINACDCFILDLNAPSLTLGKAVEYGFALKSHKLLYIVGPPVSNSIFLLLADMRFEDWDELFRYFRKNHAQGNRKI